MNPQLPAQPTRRKGRYHWPEVEIAFGLVYILHAKLNLRPVQEVYEKLGELLCRNPNTVRIFLGRCLAERPDLVGIILEKLENGSEPVPIMEGAAYVDKVTDGQLSKRRRRAELEEQGFARQAARALSGVATAVQEPEYELDAFFRNPGEEESEEVAEAPVIVDRFAPERAPEKERARSMIIALAKECLYGPALAFDLPGEGGHSSRKIKEAFPGIKIFAAESVPEIASVIKKKMATGEIPVDHLYECNASDAFVAHAKALLRPFDLVNLDVCGKWSESLVITLNALFDNKLLANNGVLAITHLAVRDDRKSPGEALCFALNLNMPPRIGEMSFASRSFTRDEVRHLISGLIQRSAITRGYNLIPLVDPFEYADDPRSPMSVYVFRAEFPVTDQEACQRKADLLEFEWAKCMLDPNKKGKFIEYLVDEYLRELGPEQREEFNERLVTILHAAEQEECG